jgi:hypothetical protein
LGDVQTNEKSVIVPRYKGKKDKRMALLVEVDHAAAKRLYERLRFCTDHTKRMAGQEYFHMERGL